MRTLRVMLFVSIITAFVPSVASAAPNLHLDWGQALNGPASSCPSGTPVVNVVFKVTNDADSGFGGGWAMDEYVKQVQVVQTTDGFCATVKYQGSFTTNAGASPSGTGTVGAGVVGTMEGGYTATFGGALKASPASRTKGNLGTFNYECSAPYVCPGAFDWLGAFFDPAVANFGDFAYLWWGWIYRGGNNGTWVNAIDGSAGDITGD